MMAVEDFRTQAEELLGFTADEPPQRALRLAALYASLFEGDPVLQEWCGVSAYFARLHATSLRIGVGFYGEMFARWGRASWDVVGPALLCFRAGEVVDGPLAPAFEVLEEARRLRKTDKTQTLPVARRGTEALVELDHRLAVQPLFDGIPEIVFRGLGAYVGVQFGDPQEAPVLVYEREDFPSASQRVAWMTSTVLPAWRAALSGRGAEVVRDLRQMQIQGWMTPAELPPRRRPTVAAT